jgi:long-chain acyl-CoA synthetase
MEEGTTLPKLLLRNAQRFGHRKAAIREKDRGIWQTYSWADALTQVKAFALGLAALGLQRDDKLAIVGDNRPRLYWALSAAQCLGGIPVPLFKMQAPKRCSMCWITRTCMVLAEDQEQVDKILRSRRACPNLRKLFMTIPKACGTTTIPC